MTSIFMKILTFRPVYSTNYLFKKEPEKRYSKYNSNNFDSEKYCANLFFDISLPIMLGSISGLYVIIIL